MNTLPNRHPHLEQEFISVNESAQKLLNNPLIAKDIWRTIEDLGLTVNQHQKLLTYNFESIRQDWLKLLAKLYVLVRSERRLSVRYIYHDIVNLNRFSQFIDNKSVFSSSHINDQLFDEYDYYLNSLILSKNSILLHYTTLINFFNLCREEGWLEVNTYWFKGRCKRSSVKRDEVEYIPEEVWQQLDEHLHHLPEPLQRMVLIIRGTGLRIGELLNLLN